MEFLQFEINTGISCVCEFHNFEEETAALSSINSTEHMQTTSQTQINYDINTRALSIGLKIPKLSFRKLQ